MSLEFAQLDYVKKLYQEGKPIILILVEGRPRIVREIEPFASAIINAYLPGMEGGRAIAQVLLGEVNPSGKLPFSYPRFVNSLVPYDHKYQEDNETSYNPQWPFGFGLSYAKFKYKQLELNQRQFDIQNGLQVKVTVTNEGAVEGKEVIQLYLSDLFSKYSSPPVKKLIDFKKITLAPQESKVINFVIKLGQLSFIAPDNRRIVEKGTFKIQVDNLSESFKLQ
jgi:beta-glucosidase